MDGIITKGVLTLRGKRITGYTIESYPEDAYFVPNPETDIAHVDITEIEKIKDAITDFHFYHENGKVIRQTLVPGEFNTAQISAENDDFAVYTILTDEPMEIHIFQITGHSGQNTSVYREPVDGVIEVEIDSKIIGKVLVYAEGDTCYTSESELLVR